MSSESKWLKVIEMTIEVGLYIGKKSFLITPKEAEAYGLDNASYLTERSIVLQKIFDELVEGGYLSCIPIEGVDGYFVRFKKRPEDFDEVVGAEEYDSDLVEEGEEGEEEKKRRMTKKEKKREYYEKNKKHICEVERLRREKNRPEGLKKLGRYVSEDELSTSWAQIPEHPGYFASREGEIVGKNGRILIGHIDRCGYKNVILREDNSNSQKRVHRLIAKTFIDKPDGKDFINHKDGNKKNNNVDNLEWTTKSENTKHSFKMGLQTKIAGTLLLRGDRLQYIKDNIGILTDEEIANHLECAKDTIRKYRYKIKKGLI